MKTILVIGFLTFMTALSASASPLRPWDGYDCANINQNEIVAPVNFGSHFDRIQLSLCILRSSRLLRNSAEFLVVDKLCDRGILSARRAVGILAQLELTEFHAQRVNQ